MGGGHLPGRGEFLVLFGDYLAIGLMLRPGGEEPSELSIGQVFWQWVEDTLRHQRMHTEGHSASPTPIPGSMGPFVIYA